MEQNKRILWIDNAKGIGIVLVVLGHTYGIPAGIQSIIYSFHMPLFFLLSGLTFRATAIEEYLSQNGFLRYVHKLFRTYIYPYFVLALLNFLGNIVFELYCGSFTIEQQLKYIVGILYCYANKSWMPMCSPIWFLPSIFLVKVLYVSIIMKKKMAMQFSVALFCGFLSYVSSKMDIPRLPWNFLPSLFGVFFFHVGVIFSKRNVIAMMKTKKSWSIILYISALLLVPAAMNNDVGMNENTYGSAFVFLLTSMTFSTLLLIICPNKKLFITWVGQNSVVFMGFNYLMRAYTIELYYLIPYLREFPIHWSISFFMTFTALITISYVYQLRGRCFAKKVTV